MSEKLQLILNMGDIKGTLAGMPLETKDDIIKNESDIRSNEHSDSGSSKASRELKSILALSKEAKLDTNIIHKRNSADILSKFVDKSEQSTLDNMDVQSQMKSIIRVDYNKPDVDAFENQETKDTTKTPTKSVLDNATLEDTSENQSQRILTNTVFIINNQRKDPFCWRCHHEKATFYCETCPRSFHEKCLKQNVLQKDRWICPVCIGIMKAENLKQRSPALREMTLEHFCGLLKFALKRMMHVDGHDPFVYPVNELDFPEYKKHVAQPQDLTCLEKNIKTNVYGSPQAFEADAQWILHNSIIFNSYQSKFTTIAKSMMKICRQEMSEIENCANCYLNANTKKKTWFVEVCPKPHMVVWAKLKGFPYWPAKAMRTNSLGMVDVRFFGAHDRAWVPCKDCYLYCLQEPSSNKHKRNDINESLKELNVYIENLKRIYGEFRYAPHRIGVDPDQELKQLRILLPRYDPEKVIKPGSRGFRKSLHRNGNCSPELESSEKDSDESLIKVDDDYVEVEEPILESDRISCDNITDESISSNSLSEIGSDVPKQDEFVKDSDEIKTASVRKRFSCDELDDTPSKSPRYDNDDFLNHCKPETLKTCPDSNNMENLLPINEDASPKVTDEPMSVMELSFTSKKTHLLFKQLSDLIAEVPDKGKIVSETDLLLDSITSNIGSVLPKPPEVPSVILTSRNKCDSPILNDCDLPILLNHCDSPPTLNRCDSPPSLNKCDSPPTVNQSDLPKTPSRNKKTIGTVEVIEVNFTESPEFTEPDELSVNIEDIVQATDISTVSISPVEREVDTNLEKPMEKAAQNPESSEEEIAQLSCRELLEGNENSNSSIEECSNPLDFVEVTENIPLEDKDSTVEAITDLEKMEDSLDIFTQTIGFDPQEKSTKPQQTNKRRRDSSDTIETTITEISPKKKSLRLVNIDDIRKKVLDKPDLSMTTDLVSSHSYIHNNLNSPTEPILSLQSLLERHLLTNTISENVADTETVTIKTEPECEQNDAEYLEQKRKYLQALNISEKLPIPPKKPVCMRTRSKSEENKIKFVTNISKVIDDVSRGSNDDIAKSTGTPPKRKEIFIKPLSQMQAPKQRARKSFPIPVRNVYPAPLHKKDFIRIGKPSTTVTNVTSIRPSPVIKPSEALAPNSVMYITQALSSVSSAVTILPTNQPVTYSTSRGNPILTMVQHPNTFVPFTPLTCRSTTEPYESQNYIPLTGETPKPRNASLSRIIPTTVAEPVTLAVTRGISAVTTATSSTASTTTSTMCDILNGLGSLTSSIPESLSKTISEIMCRAPPKLRPRPPGPLSTQFDEGLPSSAGAVTSKINSISHRLSDYFRGMLIELLNEMNTPDNPEAEIAKLKLDIEELNHQHQESLNEIKNNICNILEDVQKSIEEERLRIVQETRSSCEAECVKRVEEAKSKQWCANCFKEAQLYCCWNTSYCDYPCQEKHWSKHMSKCTQIVLNSRPLQSSSSTSVVNTSSIRPPQSLILRQTAPPKAFAPKAIIAKPTKVIVNRGGAARNPLSYVRTSAANHITLIEATPGNYELVGNGGPISVGGKFISGLGKIRTGNVISVPPAPTVTSTSITGSTPKTVLISQTKPTQPTTVISDDEI